MHDRDIVFEIDSIRPEAKFTPWGGHREIAYYLIRTLKPAKVVELGTHWGVSFFSFLQAVKDDNLACEVVAIDTWEGEEHAGIYTEEVFDFVRISASKIYPRTQYKLIRSLFDDSVDKFEDGQIDILHIDGLHTYEATKHDYYTWLPKLSENGIVLFHDVAANVEYGSRRFWEEIKLEHPFYEVDHSWGLGILFPKGEVNYEKLENNNFLEKLLVFKYKYLSGLYRDQLVAAERMIEDKDQLIQSTEQLCEERLQLIRKTEAIVENQREIINESRKRPRILRWIISFFGPVRGKRRR